MPISIGHVVLYHSCMTLYVTVTDNRTIGTSLIRSSPVPLPYPGTVSISSTVQYFLLILVLFPFAQVIYKLIIYNYRSGQATLQKVRGSSAIRTQGSSSIGPAALVRHFASGESNVQHCKLAPCGKEEGKIVRETDKEGTMTRRPGRACSTR